MPELHPENLKPFKKGNDPRRNVKGRINTQDKLKAKILAKLNKQALAKGEPLLIDGNPVTNLDVILDQWMKSEKRQALLMEYGFGKVPQALDLTSGGKELQAVTVIEIIKTKDDTSI
jgi:hypothetical protein